MILTTVRRDVILAGAWDGAAQDTPLAVVARQYGAEFPDVRVLAAALDGLHWLGYSDPAAQNRARNLIGWAIAQGVDLKTNRFVVLFLADRTWPVEVTGGIVAHLSIEHDMLLLALVELHQAAGRTARRTSSGAHSLSHQPRGYPWPQIRIILAADVRSSR